MSDEQLFDVISIREGESRTIERNLNKKDASEKKDEWQAFLSDAYIPVVVVKVVPAQGD